MLVGYTLERFAYRPLRHAPRLAPLITAIGASIVLQHVAMMVWSRNPLAFPQLIPNPVFPVAGATISLVQIVIIGTSVLMMAGLTMIVYRTRLGVAMRATSQNPHIAGLMGIDINRVIAATFMLGAALAAVAGVMVGTYYGIAHYTMGRCSGSRRFRLQCWAASEIWRCNVGRHVARHRRSARRRLYRRSDKQRVRQQHRTFSHSWC
jgi:branched-chain amino acid transport system permease protein